jgi:RHS repeat-associated protein
MALDVMATEPPSWDSGAYVYDGSGNIVRIGADTYTYDRFGRLVKATAKTAAHPNNEQQYEYDRYGNLTKITTTGGKTQTQSPAVDAATNRLTGACAGPDCIRATYDGAGNQTGAFQWDAAGVMTAASLPGRQEQYIYDAHDERIVIVSATNHTRLYTLRDPANKIVREFITTDTGANWKWTKDYVHRGVSLAAAYIADQGSTGPHRHYHSDHLGTPRLITDNLRHKMSTHTYWAFGGEAPGSDVSSPERLRFTGHERDSNRTDPSQDLDYMHARYYRAEVGRFLSVDPVLGTATQPQSWNRYSYVRNSPLRYTDPTGRQVACANNSRECTAPAAPPPPPPSPPPTPLPPVDTEGLTFFVGVTFSGTARSLAGSRTYALNVDDHLEVAGSVSTGAGVTMTPASGVVAGVTFGGTNAPAVSTLQGNGTDASVTVGRKLGITVGRIDGPRGDGGRYSGYEITIGPGVQTPTGTYQLTQTTVVTWTQFMGKMTNLYARTEQAARDWVMSSLPDMPEP